MSLSLRFLSCGYIASTFQASSLEPSAPGSHLGHSLLTLTLAHGFSGDQGQGDDSSSLVILRSLAVRHAMPHCFCSSLYLCCLCSLMQCSITEEGCRDLAAALTTNGNLRNLQLSGNLLKDTGVKLLCGALAQPSCHMEYLGWVPRLWLGLPSGQLWGTGAPLCA